MSPENSTSVLKGLQCKFTGMSLWSEAAGMVWLILYFMFIVHLDTGGGVVAFYLYENSAV